MKSNFFSSSSILRKFLVINLIIFLFLGIFTFLYLKAIEPNLVQDRSDQHSRIIFNTSNHINRLNIEFDKEGVTNFLLSTRFLFQNLDRVQLYDLNSNLLADTDTLDLAEDIFSPNQDVQETSIDRSEENKSEEQNKETNEKITFSTQNYIKEYSAKKNKEKKFVVSKTINNNFYVMTFDQVIIDNESKGYIVVSEIANDILIAVEERKNFILRTVFSVALVILVFSG